jgi:hypothetical protein
MANYPDSSWFLPIHDHLETEMRKSILIQALMPALLSFPLAVAAVDQPLDMSPLFADISLTYAGNEVIVPYVAVADADMNGTPESATVKLRVYTPGTPTTAQILRYVTPGKVVTLPPNPCIAPLTTEWQFTTKPVRDKEMVAVAYDYLLLCVENNAYYDMKMAVKTVIYAADASKSGSTAWALGYDRALIGFNLVQDLNLDGYKDLMIATQLWDDPAATAYTEIRDLVTRTVINKGTFQTMLQ